MGIFSRQKVLCNVCGKEFRTDFQSMGGGHFCCVECLREFEWRKTLSIAGKKYRKKKSDGKPRI